MSRASLHPFTPANTGELYHQFPFPGFIPGSRYVVGTNYRKACDDCFSDLERRTAERREREERARRSRSLGRPARRAVRETGTAAPAPAMSNGAVSSALDAKFSRYSAQSKGETGSVII